MTANKYMLIIGSNTEMTSNIPYAVKRLAAIFDNIVYGKDIMTSPIGMPNDHPFINKCLAITTPMNMDEMTRLCKSIEHDAGRLPEDKAKGIVKLDIDIVAVNGQVIKPQDYAREYARPFADKYIKMVENA